MQLQLLLDVGRPIAERSGGAISASVATFDEIDGTLTPTEDTDIGMIDSSVILTHFGLQDSRGADPLVERMLAIEDLPGELSTGLNTEDFGNQLVTIGPNNIQGEAGAVAPGSGVTVALGDASRTITTESDGSFGVFFFVEPGDTINLRADDGLDVDLLIE